MTNTSSLLSSTNRTVFKCRQSDWTLHLLQEQSPKNGGRLSQPLPAGAADTANIFSVATMQIGGVAINPPVFTNTSPAK
jgi:hypothetical protein